MENHLVLNNSPLDAVASEMGCNALQGALAVVGNEAEMLLVAGVDWQTGQAKAEEVVLIAQKVDFRKDLVSHSTLGDS